MQAALTCVAIHGGLLLGWILGVRASLPGAPEAPSQVPVPVCLVVYVKAGPRGRGGSRATSGPSLPSLTGRAVSRCCLGKRKAQLGFAPDVRHGLRSEPSVFPRGGAGWRRSRGLRGCGPQGGCGRVQPVLLCSPQHLTRWRGAGHPPGFVGRRLGSALGPASIFSACVPPAEAEAS